jgi:hypothetical protein
MALQNTTHLGVAIQFDDAFASDLPRIFGWLDAAVALRDRKYGLSFYTPPVVLKLHPAPVDRASPGFSSYGCWGDRPLAEVNVLTPGSPAWASVTKTLLQLPVDDNNHKKNLIHEFTHAVQVSFWGCGLNALYPQWWAEGLPEFDGLYHANPSTRSLMLSALLELVKQSIVSAKPQTDDDVNVALSLHDGYSAGALFVWFLADRFDESAQVRLLRSTPSNLWADLCKLSSSPTPTLLFRAFQHWLMDR